MNKYRFHLVASGWLPVSAHYQSCAFTQKAVKFAKMMMSLGHEVFIYGVKSENFDIPPCTEFVETHTPDDIRKAYGEGNNFFEIGYDWKKASTFKYDENGFLSECSERFYEGLLREIPKRYQEGDFLCLTFGEYFKEVAIKLNIPLTVEYGVGYPHAFTPYRAYESSYIQNWIYGKDGEKNLRAYDRIIPNYFEKEQFPFVPKEEKKDYLLYIGRLIPRKGIFIAARIAEVTKTKLIMSGQGDIINKSEWIEVVGWADPKKRADLMGHAKAVLVPTVYLEPFGGVAVEAMLCGTPVITANNAAFVETVDQGVSGFRCNTFQEYCDAVSQLDSLDPVEVRKHAERYLMENVRFEYQQWFDDITDFYERLKAGDKNPFYYVKK